MNGLSFELVRGLSHRALPPAIKAVRRQRKSIAGQFNLHTAKRRFLPPCPGSDGIFRRHAKILLDGAPFSGHFQGQCWIWP